jgi:hypothetical protein
MIEWCTVGEPARTPLQERTNGVRRAREKNLAVRQTIQQVSGYRYGVLANR